MDRGLKISAAELTAGERVLVWRRRLDLTQPQAAARLGVSSYRLRAWEEGAGRPPALRVGRLRTHEVCLLLRRRAGVKLGDLARRLGVTASWLCLMEAGRAPVARLARHWAA